MREMRRNDVAQSKPLKGPLTSQEVWDTIRYLDPDAQHFRIIAFLLQLNSFASLHWLLPPMSAHCCGRRTLEPTISTHDSRVSHDFSST
jgi:hypothetical protein